MNRVTFLAKGTITEVIAAIQKAIKEEKGE